MQSPWQKTKTFVGLSALALSLIGAAGAAWMALVYANLKMAPSIPWALPALMGMLWGIWQYLGGKGWPASTASRRKLLLRANPVSRAALAWSIAAGLLAIGALTGLWIVVFRLFPMPANPLLPARFTASPLMTAAIVLGASLLAPVVEESAVRGYLQGALERDFTPVTAVILSSIVFALAHAVQGLELPRLGLYFAAGTIFGSLAYFNRSILPVIPVHMAGDIVCFTLVWPYDGARVPLSQTGPDAWFWIHAAQTLGCAALAVWAFARLRRHALLIRMEKTSVAPASKLIAEAARYRSQVL